MKKIFLASKISVIALMFAFASVAFAATWAGPQGAPTGGNIEPPLNTSINGQLKTGSLGLGSGVLLGNTNGTLVASQGVVSYSSVFGLANVYAGLNSIGYIQGHNAGAVAADWYCLPAAGGGCINSWSQAGSGTGGGSVSVTGVNHAGTASSYPNVTNIDFASPDFTVDSPSAGHIIVGGGSGNGSGGALTVEGTGGPSVPGVNKLTFYKNGILGVADNGGGQATVGVVDGINWGDLLAWTKTGQNFTWKTTSAVTVKGTNFGINNLSPTEKLDVVGNANIVGNGKISGDLAVSSLTDMTKPVLCHDAVGKIVYCSSTQVGGSLPPGTTNYTMRYNGTDWVKSGNLQNTSDTDGTVNVGLGAPLDKWDRFHVMGGGAHIDRNAEDLLFLNNNDSNPAHGVAVISNRDYVHFWSDVQGADHSSDILVRDVKASGDGYFYNLHNTYNYAVCADSVGKLILCSGGNNGGGIVVDVKVNGVDAYVHNVGDVTGNTGYAANHTVAVSWTVSGVGVTSCTATGGWSGSKNVAGGSEQITLNVYGTESFTLTCNSQVDNGTDTATADISGYVKYQNPATGSFTPSNYPAFANVNSVTVTAVGQGGSGGIITSAQQVGQFCVAQTTSGGPDGSTTTITYNGVTITGGGGHHAVSTGGANLTAGAPGNTSNANGATVTPGSGFNPGVALQFGNILAGKGGYTGYSGGLICQPNTGLGYYGGGGAAATKTWAYTSGPISYATNSAGGVTGTVGAIKIAW